MARFSIQLCLFSYACSLIAFSLIRASLISLLSSEPARLERTDNLALSLYDSRVLGLTNLMWLRLSSNQYKSSLADVARSGLHSKFPCTFLREFLISREHYGCFYESVELVVSNNFVSGLGKRLCLVCVMRFEWGATTVIRVVWRDYRCFREIVSAYFNPAYISWVFW